MKIKEVLKKATKEGLKLGGKTFIKGAFDPKTWLIVYMSILATKSYNKLGNILNREAELNKSAANLIEQKVSTPKGMAEVCEKYNLTDEQVQEVITTQKTISDTEKVVMKTAQDSKKSWRDWLPGAKMLRDRGVRDGMDLSAQGQVALAMDAYEQAEQNLSKTNAVTRAADQRRNSR